MTHSRSLASLRYLDSVNASLASAVSLVVRATPLPVVQSEIASAVSVARKGH